MTAAFESPLPWRRHRATCTVCGTPIVATAALRKTCSEACIAEQLRRNGGLRARDNDVALEDSRLRRELYRKAFGAAAGSAYEDIAARPVADASARSRLPRPHDLHTRPVSRDWRRTAV